jgi:hypothetical protein
VPAAAPAGAILPEQEEVMPDNDTLLEIPQLRTDGGRLVVVVPWHDAERLQAHLRKQGIGSTLLLDAGEHQAQLEVWPGAEPAAVCAALEQWRE